MTRPRRKKGQRWGVFIFVRKWYDMWIDLFYLLHFHILLIILRCVMRCHHTARRKSKLHAGDTLSAIHSTVLVPSENVEGI